MALTPTELVAYLLDKQTTLPNWTWSAWNDYLIQYRSLNVKHDAQLLLARQGYIDKLKRLRDRYEAIRTGRDPDFYRAPSVEDALSPVLAKAERLAIKLRDTIREIRLRELGMAPRNPVGTTYYIDLSGGSDSADGLSTGAAWLTLQKYCADTVRTAGDIAYVRANTTQTFAADLVFDEDGTGLANMYIIGCDASVHDPWGDASNVRPILDFNDAEYGAWLDGDEGWNFQRLDVCHSHLTAWNRGQFEIRGSSYGTTFKKCRFYDQRHQYYNGITIRGGSNYFEECEFWGNYGGAGTYLASSLSYFRKCIWNAGASNPQLMGIWGEPGGKAVLEECSMGQTTAHSGGDIGIGDFLLIGCTTNDLNNGYYYQPWSFEHHTWGTGTKGADGALIGSGDVFKVTSPVRSGGSDFSIKLRHPVGGGASPFLDVLAPSISGHDPTRFYPIKVWLAAGTHTITVYIRADSAWVSYPTATQTYLHAIYFDEASGNSLAEAKSTEVLSDGTTWVGLSVTITVGHDSFVYCDIRHGFYIYEKYILIDPAPVIA